MNDDLPKSNSATDPVDALLRASEAHLPDDGFTSRVLVSLPPRRCFDRARLSLFAAAWLAGMVILLLRAPAVGQAATAFLAHVRHGDMSALAGLVPVMLVFGSLVWALVSWAIEEWT